jgi:hypothetical protein
MKRVPGMPSVQQLLEMTCLDHMRFSTSWRAGTRVQTADPAAATAKAIKTPLAAEAWGPDRTH